jgi:hypothetical protein
MTALEDLTVPNLSTSINGDWCGRLLSDFGAEVLLRDTHPVVEANDPKKLAFAIEDFVDRAARGTLKVDA